MPDKLAREAFDRGTIASEHALETEGALRQWTACSGDTWPLGPAVIPQTVARLDATLRAVHRMAELGLSIATAQALEVGAGAGVGLAQLAFAGFAPRNLTGIDLFEDRLEAARERLPGSRLVHGDAANMRPHFPDENFDLVCEQFCFCHIPTDEAKPRIAAEMLRVTKPGGFLLIHDWRMGASHRQIAGVSQAYIRRLFDVGGRTRVVKRFPSQLWPPVGRLISRAVPELYQLGWLFPPAVGSRITLLQKNG